VPLRIEIEADLDDKIYQYSIAFECPKEFKELRVLEEKLTVGSKPIYTRELANV
jgi:hypothetical protein